MHVYDFKFLIRKTMSRGKFFTVCDSKRTPGGASVIVVHSCGCTYLAGSQQPSRTGCSVLRTRSSSLLCVWVKWSKFGKNEKLGFQTAGLIQWKQTVLGAHDIPQTLCWIVSRMQREGSFPGGPWLGMEVGVAASYWAPRLRRLCAQLLKSSELGWLCFPCCINEKTEGKRTVTLCLEHLHGPERRAWEMAWWSQQGRPLPLQVSSTSRGRNWPDTETHKRETIPHRRKEVGFRENEHPGWRGEGRLRIRWSRKSFLKNWQM